MAAPIIVVHDLFGTLFSLDAPTAALRKAYPTLTPLRAHGIVLDWYQCFQRDLTALSINDAYRPASAVFKDTLPRALKQAGLSTEPDTAIGASPFEPADEGLTGPAQAEGAGRTNPYPERITQPILDSLQALTPRPGFEAAFTELYRRRPTTDDRPVHVWAATNGGAELARKLLLAGVRGDRDAGGELVVDAADGHSRGVGVFSCDEVQVSKPDPRVYAGLRRKLGLASTPGESDPDSLWFVASHSWDLFAAKRAGFKTCWVSYEEFYACPDIYGQPDIVAPDLAAAATAILDWERKEKSLP